MLALAAHSSVGSLAFYIYRSVGSALSRDALMEARELSCGMLGEMSLGKQPSRSGRQLHGQPRMSTRLGRLSRDLSLKVC